MSDKKFKQGEHAQDLMHIVKLDEALEPGSFEFAVNCVIDRLYDDDFLTERFKNGKTGCKAYLPKMMLKVVLAAYGKGILGSRRIERACRNNIPFLGLTGGLYPDHSTIANFVNEIGPKLYEVFADVLMVCEEEDLLSGTRFALDGLKLPSNASKEWSGTFQHLRKKRDKLRRKAEVLTKEHKRTDNRLAKGKSAQPGPSAYDKLMKAADKLDNFMKENEPRIGINGKEIKSNITDNESSNIATPHGAFQGHNAQALVDDKNQIIQHADMATSGQDGSVIKGFMEGAVNTAKAAGLGEDYFKDKSFLADASYHSERNLKAAEAAGVDSIIPDNMFRSRDERFIDREKHKEKLRKKKELFTVADFNYNKDTDQYICPKGEILRLGAKAAKSGPNVFRRYVIKLNNDACQNCQLRERCLTKGAKRKSLSIPLEDSEPTILQKMRDRIDTPEAKYEYSKRMGIVEPVFGNIKHNKGMRRFNYRSIEKVKWQWLLYCLVHNIEKIGRYGKSYAPTPV